MKYLHKLMTLPLLVLPFLFAACDEDRDSNPTLDLSHVAEGFVLNTPAYAENIYDLAKSEGVELTCSQPNYGEGVPYLVRYFVQVSLDPTFGQANSEAAFKELSTSFTKAKMNANAVEFNNAVVDLFQAANPDADVPATLPVYVRLRAIIDGTMTENLGETFSNVITLPRVRAQYQAPDVEYPGCLYVVDRRSRRHGAAGSRCPPSMACRVSITPWYMCRLAVPSSGEQPRATGVVTDASPSTTRLVQACRTTTTTTSCWPTADGMRCSSMVR